MKTKPKSRRFRNADVLSKQDGLTSDPSDELVASILTEMSIQKNNVPQLRKAKNTKAKVEVAHQVKNPLTKTSQKRSMSAIDGTKHLKMMKTGMTSRSPCLVALDATPSSSGPLLESLSMQHDGVGEETDITKNSNDISYLGRILRDATLSPKMPLSESRPLTPKASPVINIVILTQNDPPMTFEFSTTAPLGELFNVYAKSFGFNPKNLHFFYRGRLIERNQSPKQLKMSQNAQIYSSSSFAPAISCDVVLANATPSDTNSKTVTRGSVVVPPSGTPGRCTLVGSPLVATAGSLNRSLSGSNTYESSQVFQTPSRGSGSFSLPSPALYRSRTPSQKNMSVVMATTSPRLVTATAISPSLSSLSSSSLSRISAVSPLINAQKQSRSCSFSLSQTTIYSDTWDQEATSNPPATEQSPIFMTISNTARPSTTSAQLCPIGSATAAVLGTCIKAPSSASTCMDILASASCKAQRNPQQTDQSEIHSTNAVVPAVVATEVIDAPVLASGKSSNGCDSSLNCQTAKVKPFRNGSKKQPKNETKPNSALLTSIIQRLHAERRSRFSNLTVGSVEIEKATANKPD